MTTIEPERAVPSPPEPHRHRQVAESFGVDAERYDRTRPRYPQAMVDAIVATSPGLDFLDVGCGTGIAARQFLAAGRRVLGVEPDARMADFARRSGVDVEVATFEEWDPAGRYFAGVIAGTAWHWVDPVAGAAKAAQVLLPGARLAVFWHVSQLPAEIAAAFAAVFQRVAPDSPFDLQSTRQPLDLYQALVAKAIDGIREAGGFGQPQQCRFEWEQSYTRDEWLDQMPTQGTLTRLPADKLAEVLDGVGVAIDAMGGSFTMPYTTVVVSTARTSAAGKVPANEATRGRQQ
jgi:SAM-dependent methyltransferase